MSSSKSTRSSKSSTSTSSSAAASSTTDEGTLIIGKVVKFLQPPATMLEFVRAISAATNRTDLTKWDPSTMTKEEKTKVAGWMTQRASIGGGEFEGCTEAEFANIGDFDRITHALHELSMADPYFGALLAGREVFIQTPAGRISNAEIVANERLERLAAKRKAEEVEEVESAKPAKNAKAMKVESGQVVPAAAAASEPPKPKVGTYLEFVRALIDSTNIKDLTSWNPASMTKEVKIKVGHWLYLSQRALETDSHQAIESATKEEKANLQHFSEINRRLYQLSLVDHEFRALCDGRGIPVPLSSDQEKNTLHYVICLFHAVPAAPADTLRPARVARVGGEIPANYYAVLQEVCRATLSEPDWTFGPHPGNFYFSRHAKPPRVWFPIPHQHQVIQVSDSHTAAAVATGITAFYGPKAMDAIILNTITPLGVKNLFR